MSEKKSEEGKISKLISDNSYFNYIKNNYSKLNYSKQMFNM